MSRKTLLGTIGMAVAISGVVSLGGSAFAREEDPSEETGEASQAVCRQLAFGDPYFPRWASCCDVDDGARSRWRSALGIEGVWNGNCESWGITP